MSFEITPADVGRKVQLRNGDVCTITEIDDVEEYNFPVRLTNGEWYTVSGSFDYPPTNHIKDIVSFTESSEPATDQVADQPRPKDLRDEFAMVVSGHIWVRNVDMEINQACEMTANTAYMLADAMLKARGK